MANLKLISSSIDDWYQTELGQALAKMEQQQLLRLPDELFGPTVLQLGAPSQQHWLKKKKLHRLIFINPEKPNKKLSSFIQSHYTQLPLTNDSVNTIILPHILEFELHPKLLLKEAWQTLMPNGHLIILGFNPWSLWGIQRLLTNKVNKIPWCGRFYNAAQISLWLKRLGSETIISRSFFYNIASENRYYLKGFTWLENIAPWLFPNSGAIYLLVIKKQVVPLTPIRPRWHWRNLFINKGSVEPAAGSVHREG